MTQPGARQEVVHLRRRLAEEMKRSQVLMDGQQSNSNALRFARLRIKDLEGLLRAAKDKPRTGFA